MEINILAFGIAKDIFGGPLSTLHIEREPSVGTLKLLLEARYPRLKRLSSYMIAINNEYAFDGLVIGELDEVAIIPPVSGG